MRTLILALTVLLFAAPVWATVEITGVVDGKVITIGYTSDEGMVRAFALDIVATGGNITAIGDYVQGDDVSGYGIFPGSFDDNIVVDPCGVVSSWTVTGYTPVAPSDDPDALGDIPGPAITIELGSLYTTAGPPEAVGTLCSITVDDDVTEVCITANAIRGNVVLEDANEPANLVLPSVPDDTCIKMVSDECFPNDPTHATQYAAWVYAGKPDCWCAPPSGTGYQCLGDIAGDKQYNMWWVFTNDIGILATEWKKLKTDPTLNWCADINHKIQYNMWPVFTDDIGVLATYWKSTTLVGDCPRPD